VRPGRADPVQPGLLQAAAMGERQEQADKSAESQFGIGSGGSKEPSPQQLGKPAGGRELRSGRLDRGLAAQIEPIQPRGC